MAETGDVSTPAKKDSLALRVITSIILIPSVLISVYFGGRLFSAVVAFACIVMVFEWTRMVERREFSFSFYVIAFSAAVALFVAASGHYFAAYGICTVGGVASFAAMRRRDGARWASFAAPYIVAPSIALLWLRLDAEQGLALTFLLYAVVWAGDTGAYTFGKLVGGPKVSPILSPAKTWAGIVGGVIAGGLAGIGVGHFYVGGPVVAAFFVGGSLGAASVIGDMVESAFKRSFGVKDISGFIPGHGGALDRMDGMIFATTAMTSVLFAYMLAERAQGLLAG
ncbi:MAG: phosphatidate cytidylyltransferase [Pseudomonadota bacterium]